MFLIGLNYYIAEVDMINAFVELSINNKLSYRPNFLNSSFKLLKLEKYICPILAY